ncbi:hypothetical protein M0802_014001, partial [Mischocyttarus mexicanus]
LPTGSQITIEDVEIEVGIEIKEEEEEEEEQEEEEEEEEEKEDSSLVELLGITYEFHDSLRNSSIVVSQRLDGPPGNGTMPQGGSLPC